MAACPLGSTFTKILKPRLEGFSAPTFVEKPKISSRDDGQVLVMEFKAKSKTKPTVVWTKSDDIIAESDRVQQGVHDAGNNEYHVVLEIKVMWSCPNLSFPPIAGVRIS